MEYKKYQHIEKIGSTEVEGILNGTCYLTYKIDGTNACVFLKEDGSLGFGSRTRELSVENDNAGFVKTFTKITPSLTHEVEYIELHDYLIKHPNYIVYGEWLIPVTIKRYKVDAWHKFYVFDIYDTEKGKYINYDIWTEEFKTICPCIKTIPLIAKLKNPTVDDIKALLDKTGDFLITEGKGEGIVIKNYDYRNRYGNTIWAKMLTEDFITQKSHHRIDNAFDKVENETEHKIIQLLTPEHVQKEYNKLIEAKGEWTSSYTLELLNRVFTEFIRDNWEIILKKFHMPTVNFKVLKQMSDSFVKEVLSL